jgi:hypothetical protein
METIRHIVLQELNEDQFCRKHIDKKIRAEILANPDTMAKLKEGVQRVYAYIGQPYYASKNARIEQLRKKDVNSMVLEIFVGVAYIQRPELFTSVTSQMAARLGFSDRAAAITTVAELLAVLCQTDAFDIMKESRQASLMVVSRIPLSEGLLHFIDNSEYLPPMVCEPLPLTHNHSSGYLTHNDSLILGSGNHHEGDICLDVLNTMNKVASSWTWTSSARWKRSPPSSSTPRTRPTAGCGSKSRAMPSTASCSSKGIASTSTTPWTNEAGSTAVAIT